MKLFHRSISWLLCLALICFCLYSPLRVSASADAGLISLSLGGSAAGASVAAPIALVAVLLVGAGLVVDNIDVLVDTATDVYNGASSAVKNWVDECAVKLYDAAWTAKMTTQVKTDLKEEIEEQIELGSIDAALNFPMSYSYLVGNSSVLNNLGSITADDVFAQDVVGAINASTSVLEKSLVMSEELYSLLNFDLVNIQGSLVDEYFLMQDIAGALSDFSFVDLITSTDLITETLSGDLTDLKSLYSTFGNATVNKLEAINTSLANLDLAPNVSVDLGTVSESILDMESVLSGDLLDVKSLLGTFGNSVVNKLGTVDTSIGSLGNLLSGDLAGLKTALASNVGVLNTSIGSLQNALTTESADFEKWYGTLNNSLKSEVIITREHILSLNNNMKTELQQLKDLSATINTNMKGELQQLKDLTYSISQTVPSRISGLKTSVDSIGAGLANPSIVAPDTSVLDQYGALEDTLKIPIGNGFAIGGQYFDSVRGFLGDDLNGFLVAGLIFEEFAGISFFNKLIVTSCAVGLIGTLLGMALNLQSYSVAQRRREEAAQSKAHNRMERSRAA